MFDELEKMAEKKFEAKKALLAEKEKQDKMSGLVNQKKDLAWMRMCRDLNRLRKYTDAVDTGVPFQRRKDTSRPYIPDNSRSLASLTGLELASDETIGIEFSRDGRFHMITYLHGNADIPLAVKRKELFVCVFDHAHPFQIETRNTTSRYFIDLEYVAANWEKILPGIVEGIKAGMEAEIKKMEKESAARREDLEAEMELFQGIS